MTDPHPQRCIHYDACWFVHQHSRCPDDEPTEYEKSLPDCRFDTRTHTPAAPVTDALADLKITASMLYEFCEWFCDYDCEENPCTVTVSRLHERIEGIQNQMKAHPEYLKKWEAKRAEQEHLRKEASGDERIYYD